MNSEGVDSNSNDEFMIEVDDELNFKIEELADKQAKLETIKVKKIEWMRKFIISGGFCHLIKILQGKLANITDTSNDDLSLMNKICIQYLLKIIRIFFFSSLNKYEINKQVNLYIDSL